MIFFFLKIITGEKSVRLFHVHSTPCNFHFLFGCNSTVLSSILNFFLFPGLITQVVSPSSQTICFSIVGKLKLLCFELLNLYLYFFLFLSVVYGSCLR